MRSIYHLLLFLIPCVLLGEEKEFLDYNFDGHADYRVFRELNGRVAYFDIYLYSTQSKSFQKSAALSELFSPKPNPETKEIECFWPGGHASMIYYMEIYEWVGEELKISRVVKQDYIVSEGEGKYVRVTASQNEGKPRIDEIEYVDLSLK